MRAMPSPVDRTTPVSRTSRLFSYSRICSRMMSLISAARICMTVVLPDLTLADLGHLSAYSGQLCAETPVPNRAADVQHDPAEQLRIDLCVHDHVVRVHQPLRQLGQFGLLRRPERRGGADACPRPPELVIDQRFVRLRDLAEQPEPAAVGEELHQVADVARDTERRHDLAND